MNAPDKKLAGRILWKGKAHEMPRLSEAQDVDAGSPHYVKGLSFIGRK